MVSERPLRWWDDDRQRRAVLCLLAIPAGMFLDAILFFMAAVASGGHTGVPFIIFFPLAAFPQRFGFESPDVYDLWLGFLQYPAYCLLLATARRLWQFITYVMLVLVLHSVGVIICLSPR